MGGCPAENAREPVLADRLVDAWTIMAEGDPPLVAARIRNQVGIYCDVGANVGAGHAVRCTALAEALIRRGVAPVMLGTFSEVPWVASQARQSGAEIVEAPTADHLAGLSTECLAGFVVDSYRTTAEEWRRIRAIDVPVLAIDDEANRPLPVDLVVNQNLSADGYDYAAVTGAPVLRGPRFALVRSSVARARPGGEGSRPRGGPQTRILVLLGGTDPTAGSLAVARQLLGASHGVHVRVLVGDSVARRRIQALQCSPGSVVEALPTSPDVERHMLWADVAVSAAGSTVWELACLGTPMAVVTVADNQLDNYRQIVARKMAIGLGSLSTLTPTRVLPAVLDEARLRAAGLRAWRTVDGRGADRVAESFEALLPIR